MNPTRLTVSVTLGLFLALTGTACKNHRPTNPTPLGNSGTTRQTPDLGPGGTLSGPGSDIASGIPANAPGSHDGWTPNAETFQSDTVYFDFSVAFGCPFEGRVDPGRVDTASFGKDRPADPGHNDSAWRKNRRGQFILLTPPK